MSTHGLQRDVLNSSLRFAKGIGAEVVVCHAGQRVAARDARHSMEDQLSAERSALREAGDLAGELGVTIAVENYYPERPIVRGAIYDYGLAFQLAEQIFAVEHPAVGICLDVGHAAGCGLLRLRLYRGVRATASLVRHLHLHDNLQRTNVTGGAGFRAHRLRAGRPAPPPGRGTIPLEELFRRMEFPENPSCCVELSPELFSLIPEALHAAREISLVVAAREPLSL